MAWDEERPYSGTFVRHLKASDIEDIYNTRAFLDEYAARQAARLATQEQLDAMEVLLKKMDQAEDDASFGRDGHRVSRHDRGRR